MTGPALLVYDESFLEYDFGPSHPFRVERSKLARALMEAHGLLAREGVRTAGAEAATPEEVRLAHAEEYLEAVRAAGTRPEEAGGRYLRYGLGTGDNPVFPRMYEAAALHVGGTLAAARAVHRGDVPHALTLGGGFHHAHRAKASGFCVLNDLTVALRALLQEGARRLLYVDVDVHHGDGVVYAFYDDPRVLAISLHEDGHHLFPGTGFVHETGEGEGEGYSVHVPLPPRTADDAYLDAFRAIVPPLAEAFRPDLILSQMGADAHHRDPLAHLELTTHAYREIARELDALAHRVAGGRWVATGGGGYDPSAVARAWALDFAGMVGADLQDGLPEGWRALYRDLLGREPTGKRVLEAPRRTEPEVRRTVDTVVRRVREAVFPRHGLAGDDRAKG